MFVERSNGRYNDRTFPRDPARVWRGTGLCAVQTAEDVFEFRVWDPSRPVAVGREIALFSPDGLRKNVYVIKSFGMSEEVGEGERGRSVNCGVMVVELQSSGENRRPRPPPQPRPERRRYLG